MNTQDIQSSRYGLKYSGNVRRSIDSSRSKQFDDTASIAESVIAPLPEPRLPDLDLPQSELDLTMTFESIMSAVVSSSTVAAEPEVQRVNKRASNVLKLAQENEKLQEELRAMNARLEAAERKQQELRQQREAAGGKATAS
ncbi:hypothetical protein PHLGIDRAFT_126195 [Phlebiopsis gigantea 11061_1 CR5-6]|uniref:Uncharacterized protein n=1 Tax=Phlebiopsis gigantea (strain 11061_1 CR5-6) TaxID=745531 RepID=A0A0C3NW34_PHLG1|nr:hypothetical protein PHLGIDRAFT_126195 [Phlebiopsis gigantea 11061_1 CR5-6]